MRFARERAKRTRWLALFTILLLGTSAVPVFADAPPSEPPAEEPVSPASEAQSLPDGSDIGEALREAEEQEEEEQRWRESEEAEEEREESQDAYAEASPAEAAELLEGSFAEPLAMLEQDPARALTDAEIDQFLSLTAARIKVGGETMLMEGSIPLRAPDESGDLSKVSLDLVEAEGGFVPENPLVNVTLPRQASEGIAVGDSGLAISPDQSAGDSVARRFGQKDLLYPETQTDTSLLASPISSGVELFSELLSKESPEELRFALSLPEGAELRSDGNGGAEVSKGGRQIAAIPAPTAVDAQGADVPVEMQIEGNSLALHIAHRNMDVAYPLLVDPAISDSWYGTGNWLSGANLSALTDGTWFFKSNDWGRFSYSTESPAKGLVGGSEKGLFVRAQGTSSSQPAEHFGEWSYTAPGTTTWISLAGINPFWRFNYGCSASSYPEPHDFDGLWSPTWSPQYGWISFQSEAAKSEQAIAEPPKDWREKTAQVFILGLGTGSSSSPANPCTRDLYAGGAYVWMSDPEAPTITQPTGVPTGWINGKTQFTIKTSASDPGLGVQNITIAPSGAAPIHDSKLNCTGLSASRCPATYNSEIPLNGLPFLEGQRTATISATDALGQASNTYSFETKVDRRAPEILLNGQLATATEETGSGEQDKKNWDKLKLPVYNLKIEALDGSTKATLKQSGVKSVGVFLDSKEAPEQSWQQECSAGSCKMTKTYTLKLTGLSTGKHTLKIRAEDQLGQVSERNIEFEYVPATGITDDYMMQRFPLPDGQGNEAEEEFPDRPELAVNIMNGNLVYRQKDVEIDGPAVNLEVERFYNSQLPEAENTEWGDGWTLGQTPELEPEEAEGSQPPEDAKLVGKSGLLASKVALPTTDGESHFDPSLQVVVTKTAGGYKLTDQSGATEATTVFDESGKTQEMRTPGFAKVDYEYEGGELSEIAVTDPGAAADPSGGEEEPEYSPLTPVYRSAFGSSGTGQLQSPGDVALDGAGNIWVADKGHNRIEEFDPEGKYITAFGEYGEGKGQLNRPASLAIDAEGNIWVADADNNRIEEFSSGGKYLSEFGGYGQGNGEFAGPEGIAIDSASGDIWVADTYNGRVQRFDEDGKFIEVVGSFGEGEGEIGEATGIDVGPGGNVWIADWLNNRVEVFDESGSFVRQFGSEGTGNGEFLRPDAIDVDAQGNVWVGDQNNGRVQRFDQNGAYVGKFGSKGSGPGQFSFAFPMGIVTDEKGDIWVADVNNNRIQRWEVLIAEPGEAGYEGNDPSVEVDTSGGLVTAIKGKEAGTQTYKYSGDLPIANVSSEGETKYTYDSSGRLTKVTLPNGTYGKVTYNATYGRVASVTVDPAGSEPAKTTHFAFSTTEPRRTTVTPPTGPVVTYDIGEDGSVLKWWNAVEPPKFEDLAGSLYFEKETEKPISAGDKTLHVLAHSNEGIASIQVIAEGNNLVDEETCEQNYENLETECQYVTAEWVMNTSNFPPGILNLEVITTDRIGQAAAQRFWVNIPQPPPPPPPGAPVPPTYEEVKHFREEYGLDVVDPVSNKSEVTERIFDSINAWWTGDPVARASSERWGVPLRLKDVEEMEYREWYVAVEGPLIDEWGYSHFPSTYAGYQVDHRSGGIIRIGFTQNQQQRVAELISGANLPVPDRISTFLFEPSQARLSLESLELEVANAAENDQQLSTLVNEVGIEDTDDSVAVGVTNVEQAEQRLTQLFGSLKGLRVVYQPEPIELQSGRNRVSGRMLAGDRIVTEWSNQIKTACTAGFGAYEDRQTSAGPTRVRFLLSSGHCAHLDQEMFRTEGSQNPELENRFYWHSIGHVTRDPFWDAPQFTDALAIKLNADGLAPHNIYGREGARPPIKAEAVARRGQRLCVSGSASDRVKCGKVLGIKRVYVTELKRRQGVLKVDDLETAPGDSGAPVWNARTGAAVGLLFGGYKHRKDRFVQPLRNTPTGRDTTIGGALDAPQMYDLHVITDG